MPDGSPGFKVYCRKCRRFDSDCLICLSRSNCIGRHDNRPFGPWHTSLIVTKGSGLNFGGAEVREYEGLSPEEQEDILVESVISEL